MESLGKYYSIPKRIHPNPCSLFPDTKTKIKPLRVTFKSTTSYEEDEWTPRRSTSQTKKRRSLVNRHTTSDENWNPPKRSYRITSTTSQAKSRRSLITLATASAGKWNDRWTCDYVFSLEELRLGDLAEEDSQVFITLTIDKHASFGFSVHGRIITSFGKKCISCSSSYCREINTTFDVWVLPSSRDNRRSVQLPDIGGDDPSVIYVKPGCEANLDSLIQDAIRLTTSVKETCSDICEKSEQIWQCIGTKETTFSVDGRWSTLLKLKK